jgi:hypothetical protein
MFIMSVSFSKSLIKEYQTEMYSVYGVLVSDQDAQIQLRALARSMFPTVIAVNCAESREQGASRCFSNPCAGSLSATMAADSGNGVGASITPTSGHREKKL